jgi:putative tryptophan/tyrosine transport system substrate-binding protein
MPVIAYLNGAAAADSVDLVTAFQNGLHEAGYVEGQNVAIEYGWAEDHYDRLPALADEAVRHNVSVIAATSNRWHWRHKK